MSLIFSLVVLWLAYLLLRNVFRRNKSAAPEQKWEFASVYRKKTYLFDSNAEFELFKILNQLFADRYYIFAQVNYSHVVEVRVMNTYDMRPYRSRIDKKSADFVLCDKAHVIPQLVIELDGFSHESGRRKERDHFIDELMKDVGLPILHIKTSNLNREFVKSETERVLGIR